MIKPDKALVFGHRRPFHPVDISPLHCFGVRWFGSTHRSPTQNTSLCKIDSRKKFCMYIISYQLMTHCIKLSQATRVHEWGHRDAYSYSSTWTVEHSVKWEHYPPIDNPSLSMDLSLKLRNMVFRVQQLTVCTCSGGPGDHMRQSQIYHHEPGFALSRSTSSPLKKVEACLQSSHPHRWYDPEKCETERIQVCS